MKITESKRAYHQRVLQEVSQMLRISGKTITTPVNAPPKTKIHDWAARKVQALVKA